MARPPARSRIDIRPGTGSSSMLGNMAGEDTNPGGWKWVYVIPLMALTIPIIAIANVDITEILTSSVAAIVIAIGGGTLAGRYLLGYRHQLRLSELEAQREVAALEAHQLAEAQRLLDLDDRLHELKPAPKAAPPSEA